MLTEEVDNPSETEIMEQNIVIKGPNKKVYIKYLWNIISYYLETKVIVNHAR